MSNNIMCLSWILVIALCSLGASEGHQAMQPVLPADQEFSVLSSKIEKILKNQNEQSMKQSQQATEFKVFGREIWEFLSQLTEQHKQTAKKKRREDNSGGLVNFERVCKGISLSGVSDDDWNLICSFLAEFNMKLMEFLMEPDEVMGLIRKILGKPSDCKCGLAQRTSRIVGGVKTEVNEYPWQVALVVKSDSTLFCGGSVIADRWILTAAHCVKDDKPDKLQVCLPLEDSGHWAGMDALVTGWGTNRFQGSSTSNVLMEADVQVITNLECRNLYFQKEEITKQMLCAVASSGNGGKDSCQGDSGGPLVSAGGGDGVTAGQNYNLIGIVSWGVKCGHPDFPGVYSRVTKQLKWIKRITKGSFKTCERV